MTPTDNQAQAAIDNMLKKVQKLLNLADPDSGATPHERDLAMQRAQELMFKHDLSMMDVTQHNRPEDEVIQQPHSDAPWLTKTKHWEGTLAYRIGRACYCNGMVRSSGTQKQYILVGRPADIEFTMKLTKFLIPWLRIEARHARQQAAPSNPAAFNRAFYDSASSVIMMRLKAQKDHLASSLTKGTDLVLQKDRAVTNYMDSLGLKKSRSRGYSNTAGHVTGADAGHRASLNSQINQ